MNRIETFGIGVSDQLAVDEYDAIRKAREYISHLNWQKLGNIPLGHLSTAIEEPKYNPGMYKCV